MLSDYAPSFVKSRTALGLRKAMLKAQATTGTKFEFSNIQQAQDGFWYAWFVVRRTDDADI